MKVLVTGADGFVGSWLVPALTRAGHDVIAAVRPGGPPAQWLERLPTMPLELTDATSVQAVARQGCEAIVHLAGVASGADARRDPVAAWEVNALGTVRLAQAAASGLDGAGSGPLLLVASTAEVYGAGARRPLTERDAVRPCSPYAASKLSAEIAALEVGRRTELPVIVTRAFPHIGRGQDTRFVVPAFARRLLEAKRRGDRTVPVGNLEPIRDFLHVSDVVRAYALLLERRTPGEVYNVAAGRAVSIRQVFEQVAHLVGADARPVPDPDLVRTTDIPYLVGDASKLMQATGWEPEVSLEDALAEVVDAQTD